MEEIQICFQLLTGLNTMGKQSGDMSRGDLKDFRLI